MKTPSLRLVLLLLAACAASSRAQTNGDVAGQFDSYTFSLSWEPAFCAGKSSVPECRSETAGRFDATSLALHGLWPDVDGDSQHAYGYCGVDSSVQAMDHASTWCQMPEPALSDATRSALSTVMPGVASCLDHHEWNKHGSCSGLDADAYFTEAAALVQQVAATNFGKFLTAHAGQTVSADDVLSAFEVDFGAGSRDLVTLNCASVRGSKALLEVRLTLNKNLGPAADLASMLLPTGGQGNCPSSFLLDPVPSN